MYVKYTSSRTKCHLSKTQQSNTTDKSSQLWTIVLSKVFVRIGIHDCFIWILLRQTVAVCMSIRVVLSTAILAKVRCFVKDRSALFELSLPTERVAIDRKNIPLSQYRSLARPKTRLTDTVSQ